MRLDLAFNQIKGVSFGGNGVGAYFGFGAFGADCPSGCSFDGQNCVDENQNVCAGGGSTGSTSNPCGSGYIWNADASSCDPIGGSGGTGTTPAACGSYPCSTPSDNVYVQNCAMYDANANCVQCNSGFNLDNAGNYTSCVAAGSSSGSAPTNSLATAIASIGKALTGSSMPKSANASAAACAAAKGTWTGTTCASSGSLVVGGLTISLPMLLLLGGGLLLLAKKR
jgi:hypothetical protein